MISPVSELAFGLTPQPQGLVARKYELANGLGVILLKDSSAPVIAYQTWFKVGSRNEREGRTGIAHLFEHLMFNQTESLPPGEFDRRIEAVGGETNAGTWVDWTYYRTMRRRRRWSWLMRLEAERMQHLIARRRAGRVRARGGRERASPARRRSGRGIPRRGAVQARLRASPVPLADHRLDAGHPGHHHRRLPRFLSHLLRAEQRDAGARRRLRRGGDARAHRARVWRDPAPADSSRRSSPRSRRRRPRGARSGRRPCPRIVCRSAGARPGSPTRTTPCSSSSRSCSRGGNCVAALSRAGRRQGDRHPGPGLGRRRSAIPACSSCRSR